MASCRLRDDFVLQPHSLVEARVSAQCQVGGCLAEDIEGFDVEGGREDIIFSGQVLQCQSAKVRVALLNHRGFGCGLASCSCCAAMCRIQHGDVVPYRLADGEVFTIPEPSGSGPGYMRFTNLPDSTATSSLDTGFPMSCTHTDTGRLVSPSAEGFSDCLICCQGASLLSRQVHQRKFLGRCEGLRHAQQATALPRHPSFGCVRVGGASLSLRPGSSVFGSPLVSDAHGGKARGQAWALPQILRCWCSTVARGPGSAQVWATVDVLMSQTHFPLLQCLYPQKATLIILPGPPLLSLTRSSFPSSRAAATCSSAS